MSELGEIYADVERGVFPPADGAVRFVPPPSERDSVVVAFTAHFVVAADVDEQWARPYVPDGDFTAPLNPPFLYALEQKLGRQVGCIDVALLAPRLEGTPDLHLEQADTSNHARVERSLEHRDDVRTYVTDGAVLTVGRGLAGRWEAAFEVDPTYRGRGLGRRVIEAARHLVPEGASLWCQVSPGNAASLRAVLAAGFQPVGSEAILTAESAPDR
ncbi:GNAT family N-acetyltransferase [Tenggerimyces flavus]|uniref:GNAT family N-acetyltransferase n=1 Tax=Tenggerimyces flavus TaxID=1708749 RepID=A0ABV7YL37_9ACTN|nr:GNAT family N-acetyltransferase [Tenggerimyces flavus]MBM7787249.1 GNAT superfamily N-acetyltransferase [Tenggerimyces flavus]